MCSNQCMECIGGCYESTCLNCSSSCSTTSSYCLCTTFDITLSANPSAGSLDQGSSTTTTITANLTTLRSFPTKFNCLYLPSGASCSFSPVSCTPSCSSALTIYTSPTTPVGTYDMTVVGEYGQKKKWTIYTLTVKSLGTPQMKAWIKDPNGKIIVDSATLNNCTFDTNTKSCLYNYYTCGVTGNYSGQTQDVGSGKNSSWENLWYCESCGNKLCDIGENCTSCQDCYCLLDQLCCKDGTCRAICDDYLPCNNNTVCEQGESCNCIDCHDKKDACDDDLICNATAETCQCPDDKPYWNFDKCGPTPLCGNGQVDTDENCINCPNDAGCGDGTRCCLDGICRADCDPPCDNNGYCDANETYYETCNCNDCRNKEDKCLYGLICRENNECGCNPYPDYICPSDPACKYVDPDCKCVVNGRCELKETQENCPSDCKTSVSVSPSRMLPGDKVNVTVYFNDSRYYSGEDAELVLYLDDKIWINCPVHNSRWKNMGWNSIDSWKGTYQSSNMEIASMNGYAKIVFDCIVPNLNPGQHTLRAIPSIFSEQKILRSGETQFYSSDNPVKLLKFILLSIKVIF